jgi:hypothetical protein
MNRINTLSGLVMLAVLALAGCSSSNPPSRPSSIPTVTPKEGIRGGKAMKPPVQDNTP